MSFFRVKQTAVPTINTRGRSSQTTTSTSTDTARNFRNTITDKLQKHVYGIFASFLQRWQLEKSKHALISFVLGGFVGWGGGFVILEKWLVNLKTKNKKKRQVENINFDIVLFNVFYSYLCFMLTFTQTGKHGNAKNKKHYNNPSSSQRWDLLWLEFRQDKCRRTCEDHRDLKKKNESTFLPCENLFSICIFKLSIFLPFLKYLFLFFFDMNSFTSLCVWNC